MLSVNEIKSLDLEISSHCVASCPMCPRNFYGMKHNGGYPVTNVSLANFTKVFSKKFIMQLESVRFNGNFGDFNMNPEAAEIVEYLRQNNSEMKIEINTNGHSRSKEFYRRLATSDPEIRFDLDGLGDTHHLHRKGTSFQRVLENAKEFINAGGKAVWKMIVFDHNKHQVDECRKLATDLKFNGFIIANDGRNDAFVFKNDGSHSHTIGKPPHRKPLDARELLQWKAAHDWRSDVKEKKRIVCQALRDKKIFMSSTGDIYPCCWLGFSPKTYDDKLYYGNGQLKELMGDVKINAISHGLDTALEWFTRVEDSWRKKDFKSGKLYRCDMYCGKN